MIPVAKIGAGVAAGLAVFLLLPMLGVAAIAGVIMPAAVSAIDCDGPTTLSGTWRPPLTQKYAITSPFGTRFHPILKVTKLHNGIDLVALPNPGPVVAAHDGTVTLGGYNTAYGNQVVLDHGGGLQTRYGHMASLANIRVGQEVAAGTKLGIEGATGYATGNHLHFEVIKNGTTINPAPFMADHSAPLDGKTVALAAPEDTLPVSARHEGGIGFALPKPGTPRRASVHAKPLPIPGNVKGRYVAAATKYKIPWTLLAGIGMEETGHGRNTNTSTAGARGLMQFMPATWQTMGVDGDGDGRADITNQADSIYSAANYLTKSGVSKGATGVRKALFAYNHADWYVNDVLFYAQAYGGGTVLGDPIDCGPGTGNGDPSVPAVSGERLAKVLSWAGSHVGDRYVFGGNGPNVWDCSSFTQAAYRQAGISMPRTAGAQRDWLAKGNGYRVKPGQEKPGDLIFWDSFLGPNQIGHVAMVWNRGTNTTVDARNSRLGVGHFSYTAKGKHIFQIWRVGNLKAN